MNIKPSTGGADLTLMEEDSAGQTRNGFIEIGVRKDDHRRLAAKLERDALEIPRGRLGDFSSVATEPVNATLSTPSCSTRAEPAGEP